MKIYCNTLDLWEKTQQTLSQCELKKIRESGVKKRKYLSNARIACSVCVTTVSTGTTAFKAWARE
jgi:hypothetical protein